MLTIAEMADQIGEHICKQAGLESEVKKVCFGIEVILTMSVAVLITIILGGVLGIFQETLIITLAAFLMKFIVGGPHLSGFFRCLIYSAGLLLLGAWLCNTYQFWLTAPVVVLLLTLDLFIIITASLVPSYRTFDTKQTFSRKILAAFLILISSLPYFNHVSILSVGALIGFSIPVINISPMGTGFVRWLDRITKRGGVVQ